MDHMQKDIARRGKKIFDQKAFVKRVYLFGSFARGEEKAGSDIDFMVELDGSVGLEFFCLYDELQEEFKKAVDVITDQEAEQMLTDHPASSIMKDRVLIYER